MESNNHTESEGSMDRNVNIVELSKHGERDNGVGLYEPPDEPWDEEEEEGPPWEEPPVKEVLELIKDRPVEDVEKECAPSAEPNDVFKEMLATGSYYGRPGEPADGWTLQEWNHYWADIGLRFRYSAENKCVIVELLSKARDAEIRKMLCRQMDYMGVPEPLHTMLSGADCVDTFGPVRLIKLSVPQAELFAQRLVQLLKNTPSHTVH